jgi:YggT family protein
MFILGNIFSGIAVVLDSLLQLYTFVLIGRAIISWVDASPYNPIVRFLILATEPVLRRIRPLLPHSLRVFPIDIAFLVLIGIVQFARIAVVQTLLDLGQRLR